MTSDIQRRVCFVTGTRAEFGLMQSVLRAIRSHPALGLQVLVTGMHLSRAHGGSVRAIESAGWEVDAVVKWGEGSRRRRDKGTRGQGDKAISGLAEATGAAMGGIARELGRLRSDIVLVAGDRVEAFAAAAAGHLSGRVVAHVHGGDRALGQVDDSLRHAITKLSHVHFPATAQSAARIRRLGEDRWRIHRVGSPGIDGIAEDAEDPHRLPALRRLVPRRFALVVLHPVEADEPAEYDRAGVLIDAVRSAGPEQVVIVYPNNDPGWRGIAQRWRLEESRGAIVLRNVQRGIFLGLMRDAAVMAGNSSAGVIEAASFGTPVIDVGDRQLGRQRSGNVMHVAHEVGAIRQAVEKVWNGGRPRRARCRNVYGRPGAGERIARVLAGLELDQRLRRKLIAY